MNNSIHNSGPVVQMDWKMPLYFNFEYALKGDPRNRNACSAVDGSMIHGEIEVAFPYFKNACI